MLLTIDIGTSNFKAAVWDFDGRRVGFTVMPLPVFYGDGDKHEIDSRLWLAAFEDCCRNLAKNKNINLSAVEAIVISGNGPTLVPVLGEPEIISGSLYVDAEKARLWLDRRDRGNAEKFQEEVSHLMGGFVDAGFFLPRILGIKNYESDLYRRVKVFLGCPEFLAYALTGQARTVFPSEGFDRWFWNDAVLKTLELDAAKFPPFIRPGDSFGNLSRQTSQLFGFAKDIPVIAGGPDFFAAIIGAGATEPGQAINRTGSSEGINLCTKNRVADNALMSYSHPVKPYWNLSGIINTTGKAVEWGCGFLELSYEEFIRIAGESKPGSGGLVFHPYLAGERAPVWDSSIRGSWQGINLNTQKCDFANSILEGIGFAIRDVITVMEEACVRVNDETVKELRVTGGMADTGYLNQIKADITGKVVLVPACKEAELLGCAVIGSCFLGKFSSFAEASLAFVGIEKIFEPNHVNKDLYDGLFDIYKERQKICPRISTNLV